MKLENETQNWEVLDDANKLITCGKLQMLEEMKEILVGFQESYTRLLVVNGIKDDEEMNTFIKTATNKLQPPPPLPAAEVSFVGDSGDEADTKPLIEEIKCI
tara:strand:- start:505 stop:810 length:306 start_codon:yes stop_codon:yes gene_type:complete